MPNYSLIMNAKKKPCVDDIIARMNNRNNIMVIIDVSRDLEIKQALIIINDK